MILDIKDILDYMYCPLIQKYKSENIDVCKKNIRSKYEGDMKKFTYAYHLLMNSKGVNIEKAKGIFTKLWLSNKKDQYLYVDSGDYRNTQENLRKLGIDSIISFHSRVSKELYKPLLFNYRYILPIGKNISIKGTIDLVMQDSDGELVAVCYKPLSTLYRKESISSDIEAITMAMAVKHIFDIAPAKVFVHMLDKDKRYLVDNINETLITDSLKAIGISIYNNLYYKGNFDRCYKCPYIENCIAK